MERRAADGCEARLPGVRQVRHRRGDERMHPATLRAGSTRNHRAAPRIAIHDPSECRGVDGLGMCSLTDLRQLLGIAEQQQALRRDRHRDGRRERELPRLVDHEQVERPAGKRPSWLKSHAVPPTTKPCSAYSFSERRDAVLRHSGVKRIGDRVVLRRLADPRGGHTRVDDPIEHVLDDGVRLGDDADLPAVLAHQPLDHVRADVRLARSRRALNGEVAAIEVAQSARRSRTSDQRDRRLPDGPRAGAVHDAAAGRSPDRRGKSGSRRSRHRPTRRSRPAVTTHAAELPA